MKIVDSIAKRIMGIELTYIFSLIGSVIFIEMARIYWPKTVVVVLSRLFFCLLFFECGDIYNRWLEKYDCSSNRVYFMYVIVIQFTLTCLAEEGGTISGVFNGEFKNNALFVILLALNGIAFNLRVSKILCQSAIGQSNLVKYISQNTFSIMMHHIFAIFLLNGAFAFICYRCGIGGFDFEAWKNDFWYRYCPNNNGTYRLLYVIVSFLFPLIACKLGGKVKGLLISMK